MRRRLAIPVSTRPLPSVRVLGSESQIGALVRPSGVNGTSSTGKYWQECPWGRTERPANATSRREGRRPIDAAEAAWERFVTLGKGDGRMRAGESR